LNSTLFQILGVILMNGSKTPSYYFRDLYVTVKHFLFTAIKVHSFPNLAYLLAFKLALQNVTLLARTYTLILNFNTI
jgi:hypothetical protein